MSMDPSKWTGYDQLSDRSKKQLERYYPYMNFENCQFQEKYSGVFYRYVNSVKIEKLLDEERTERPARATARAASASGGGRSRR